MRFRGSSQTVTESAPVAAPSASSGDSNEKKKVSGRWPLLELRQMPMQVCALLMIRSFAAATAAIADCDETFNYWEPAHFISFGHGFQTWEYSPVYALRSYLFLLPHSAVMIASANLLGRPAAFFVTRGVQALMSVTVELCFVSAISARFGSDVGHSVAWLLVVSPGMFVATVAFLPSSVAMLQVCSVWACWLSGYHSTAIFVGACAVVVVWPFAGLLFVPLGLHALWVQGPFRALMVAIASFLFWSCVSLSIDSIFYGRTVLPALQILRYNVLESSSGGAELYGVEPWHFYMLNGFLNLNASLLAAAALPILTVMVLLLRFLQVPEVPALGPSSLPAVLGVCSAAFLWFGFFSAIPHKEERFLVPSYPILILAAAASLQWVTSLVAGACRYLEGPWLEALARRCCVTAFMLVAGGLGASRIAALHTGYTAPVTIYAALSERLAELRTSRGRLPTHVCIGAEWHRFMTSFFLPDSADHLAYVRFGPTGLLPAEFNVTLGTSGIPPHMNDRNLEEASRYIDPRLCDFLIDLDLGGDEGGDIKSLREEPSWVVAAEAPFLNAAKSRQPWRAFFVPRLSAKKNVYASYRLLQRKPDWTAPTQP